MQYHIHSYNDEITAFKQWAEFVLKTGLL